MNAISVPAEILPGGETNAVPMEHAGAPSHDFAALLLSLWPPHEPTQPATETAGLLSDAAQELNVASEVSRAAQVPGELAGINSSAAETLDQLNAVNETSLEHSPKPAVSEMPFSRSKPPEPEPGASVESLSNNEAGHNHDRVLPNLSQDHWSWTNHPLAALRSFDATPVTHPQRATSAEPKQILSLNHAAAPYSTSLTEESNSHEAAEANRESIAGESSLGARNQPADYDPSKTRSDSRQNRTLDRPVDLTVEKATQLFKSRGNDQLLDRPIIEHDVAGPSPYLDNARRQPVPMIGAEPTIDSEAPKRFAQMDPAGELDSRGILRSGESVATMHSPDLQNGNSEFSYPQKDSKQPGEPFQIATDAKFETVWRDARLFQSTSASEPALTAPQPQAVDWRPTLGRLVGEISGRIHLGKQQALLQLEPAELGKVQIDLHMEGDKLAARILTETPESRALIESHLPELRQALVEHRVELVEVHIDSGSWSGQRGEGQPSQHDTDGWRQAAGPLGELTRGDMTENEPARPASPRGEGQRVSRWA